MCGIVGIRRAAGRGPDPAGGAAAAGVPRLRLGGHRGLHAHRAEGPQGQRPGRRPGGAPSRRGSRAPPASATPAGPPTASPATRTPTRTSTPTQRIAVVHNGIIENADELRAKLERRRRRVPLRDRHRGARPPDRRARRGADDAGGGGPRRRCARSSAPTASPSCDAERPDRIVVARNGSPVVLGIGEKEMFVASDVAALVALHPPGRPPRRRRDGHPHGRRLPHLHHRRLDHDGHEPVHRRLGGRRRTTSAATSTYMHQGDPRAARRGRRARCAAASTSASHTAHLGGLNLDAREARAIRRVKILGCGTAYYAGRSARS